MKDNVIYIPFNDIIDFVSLRTYYRGESVKRKDMDADLTQVSEDDKAIIRLHAQTAAASVCGILIQTLPCTRWLIEDEDLVFSFHDVLRPDVRDLLRKAIFDYVTNQCVIQWYYDTMPELAAPYVALDATYQRQVVVYGGMLRNMGRRKYRLF